MIQSIPFRRWQDDTGECCLIDELFWNWVRKILITKMILNWATFQAWVRLLPHIALNYDYHYSLHRYGHPLLFRVLSFIRNELQVKYKCSIQYLIGFSWNRENRKHIIALNYEITRLQSVQFSVSIPPVFSGIRFNWGTTSGNAICKRDAANEV